MHEIRKEQTELIPEGTYCHEEEDLSKVCPYWTRDEDYPDQNNGVCLLFGYKDWEDESWFALLWDQVKTCNINLGK